MSLFKKKLKSIKYELYDRRLIDYLSITIGLMTYIIFIYNSSYQNIFKYIIFLFIPSFILIISYIEDSNSKLRKSSIYLILLIYFNFLISLIITRPIKGLELSKVKYSDFSLIPFKTIINSIMNRDYKNIIYNFLMFMPLSIFLPLAFDKFKKFKHFLKIIIVASFAYLLSKFMLSIEIFNIDIIILNIAGSSLVFLLIYKTKIFTYLKSKIKLTNKFHKFLNINYCLLFIILICLVIIYFKLFINDIF